MSQYAAATVIALTLVMKDKGSRNCDIQVIKYRIEILKKKHCQTPVTVDLCIT